MHYQKSPLFPLKLATVGLIFSLAALPAVALEKIESTQSINRAILHGARHQDAGLFALLGPNWLEGSNGALLNIYSPFMMIASRATRKDLPAEPTSEDYKKARKSMGRLLSQLTDPKEKQEVKFSVSFYGKTPDFASKYRARIHGFGRGQEVDLEPVRQFRDKTADLVSNSRDEAYSAINSYYFRFDELEPLDEYEFILENPAGDRIVFRVNNRQIY